MPTNGNRLALAYGAIASFLLWTACSNKTSTSDVSGAWTGSITSPGAIPVGIRFMVAEQNGQLTGQAYVQDPVTHDFLIDAPLTGSRHGSDATWTTATNLVIAGTFDGNDFVGTLQFPADEDLGLTVSNLSLKR